MSAVALSCKCGPCETRKATRRLTLLEIADIAARQAGCAAPDVAVALRAFEVQLLEMARRLC